MKRFQNSKWVLFVIFSVLLLSSCAAGDQKFDFSPAGFWMGLWHGFISLFTFVISLFNDSVTVYEVSNTGKLYDLGFIIGIAIFYGGGSKSSCKKW